MSRSKYKVNDVFGGWKIVEEYQKTATDKIQGRAWVCECQNCGKQKIFSTGTINTKLKNKYGCNDCRLNATTNNIIDTKIGKWTILKRDKTSIGKRHARFICRCECGTIKSVARSNLFPNGHNRHPQCSVCGHAAKSNIEFVTGKFRRNAKLRNLKYKISNNFLEDLLKKQSFKCALSGEVLFFNYQQGKSQTATSNASLDRIDSSKGYVKENVQWTTKDINKMKLNHSQEKFIKLCNLVAKTNPL